MCVCISVCYEHQSRIYFFCGAIFYFVYSYIIFFPPPRPYFSHQFTNKQISFILFTFISQHFVLFWLSISLLSQRLVHVSSFESSFVNAKNPIFFVYGWIIDTAYNRCHIALCTDLGTCYLWSMYWTFPFFFSYVLPTNLIHNLFKKSCFTCCCAL